MDQLKQFLLTFIIFLGIDFVWLGYVSKKLYDEAFIHFERSFRLVPAFFAYVLIALGITLFVIPKANGSTLHAFVYGAIFGLITYGVYDFTNYATLSNWSLKILFIDIIWGMLICGIVSMICVSLISKNI